MSRKPCAPRSGTRRAKQDVKPTATVLRTLSAGEAFHFYRAIGQPLNTSAYSLADFTAKIASVEVQSLEFHFQRRDFENWIRNTIGDAELALAISNLNRELRGEALRNELNRIVKDRLAKLAAGATKQEIQR
jgi:hypothetical protein